ncbi:amino acid ABC transporter substrate-binding protein, PAAT family [Oceanospirillum multiglobuliferum]|uniref:Amino acid ABC transporter substrate-binding protein n=1 Tax=Oceanospirillum multiglobuliferum TaxID=64969 RepID=A0A1T4Q182_9GAMM|nr:amino acid ABC transporter substrate-binding protein [Oceanospirillum multiglobuliferum]OPX55459.1 amino acid ABC transporter substrate-binding protein [Oceanospirillum multiglobuliferum]SJZ97281.1 amino acid ABC transporter substrate-binding protein, PAAT family [Oceanospirillum multiglobuliferum]
MKKISLMAASAAMALSFTGLAQAAGTLDSVKERGYVQCGVTTGLPGYSNPDDKGNWTGMDVDVCRAVAAATLGAADKVKYIPLNAKERFTALQSGEIDMLSRVTTWTLTRDGSLGVNFTGVTYYDGQGFLISKKLGVKSALELDGASVCIQAGTTTELNAADYFRENKMTFEPVVFDTSDQTVKGFESGRCDVLTSDQSQLYAMRIKLSNPSNAVVLPEIISKEPLGPLVRQGDDEWFNIVKWSLYAMINAEEMGLTSKNIDKMMTKGNPNIDRFAGKGITSGLGISGDWAYQIVKQVGNYGEAFDRNLGNGSPLKIERGLNALWNKGGLQYAPPMR